MNRRTGAKHPCIRDSRLDMKAKGIASCGELRKESFGGAQQLIISKLLATFMMQDAGAAQACVHD